LLMPGMDGIERARAIKADPATRDTVLILLTSISSAGDAPDQNATGLACSLVKPIRQSQLLDAMMQVVISATAHVPREAVKSAEMAGVISRTSLAARPRILLAEDHEIGQEVATAMLPRPGYQCDVVGNGRLAV